MNTASVFSPLADLPPDVYSAAAHRVFLVFQNRGALGSRLSIDELLEHALLDLDKGAEVKLRERLLAVVRSVEQAEGRPLVAVSDAQLRKYLVALDTSVAQKLAAAYGLDNRRAEAVLNKLRKVPLASHRDASRPARGKIASVRAQARDAAHRLSSAEDSKQASEMLIASVAP